MLKEYLFLNTAGSHHHLYFCLILMGFRDLLNEIVAKETKNQCLFQISKVHQYFCQLFLLVIPHSAKNYVKLCKYEQLMFLWRIFSKALRVQRKCLSIKIWWNFMWFSKKLDPSVQIYGQCCDKNLIDLSDFLRIWSHLLKKPLMKNFFCAVWVTYS